MAENYFVSGSFFGDKGLLSQTLVIWTYSLGTNHPLDGVVTILDAKRIENKTELKLLSETAVL
ncbi:MAG: hypothetical protein E6884_02665 [Streptococcus mitis]|nr:hypothetical protein [Streptococcus mitis]